MTDVKVVRVVEGEWYPINPCDYTVRLLATELEPYGTGTASRRVYVLLVERTGAPEEGADG